MLLYVTCLFDSEVSCVEEESVCGLCIFHVVWAFNDALYCGIVTMVSLFWMCQKHIILVIGVEDMLYFFKSPYAIH